MAARKTSPAGSLVLFLVSVLLCVVVGRCNDSRWSEPEVSRPAPTSTPAPPRTITYWASGSVPDTRTYITTNESWREQVFVKPGWMRTVTVRRDAVAMNVHNPYDFGVVNCAILDEDQATILDEDLGREDFASCEVDWSSE